MVAPVTVATFGGLVCTPVATATISGPSNGGVNEPLCFSVAYTPTTATDVTFNWDGSPVGDGTAEVRYNRLATNELFLGANTVTCDVGNDCTPGGFVRATQTVTVYDFAARGVIYDIINGLSELGAAEKAWTGPVYPYKRWTALRPDFLTLFKTTDANDEDTIRGFEITLHNGNAADERIEFSNGTRRGVQQTLLFNIYGYFTWDDAGESEIIAGTTVNQVMRALDKDETLHDGEQFIDAGLAQLLAFEPWLFGSTLVHRATIQQSVTTYFFL